MVQTDGNLGLARFVSGYLMNSVVDQNRSTARSERLEQDFTPTCMRNGPRSIGTKRGWIGLDATSGLWAGEGHIPLAATPEPASAAPVTGAVEPCEATFNFSMTVTRLHEDPRVTKPYSEEQWQRIESLGHRVDAELEAGAVRLTMGGEPTFVSIDDMDGAEWNDRCRLARTNACWRANLVGRSQVQTRRSRAEGAILHTGQGKQPGESPAGALGLLLAKETASRFGTMLQLLADDRTDLITLRAAQSRRRKCGNSRERMPARRLGIDARSRGGRL